VAGKILNLDGPGRAQAKIAPRMLPEEDTIRFAGASINREHEVRTHLSLGKDAPCTRPIERFGDIIAQPILGGLHH